MGSTNNSSAHARKVAEGAHGELAERGFGEKLKFCVTELSEAGAIHSDTKWGNPLVKAYGVESAPWMLMFSRGERVFSEKPAPAAHPERGGIGFAGKLRYMAFAKPRVLVLEPALDFGM